MKIKVSQKDKNPGAGHKRSGGTQQWGAGSVHIQRYVSRLPCVQDCTEPGRCCELSVSSELKPLFKEGTSKKVDVQIQWASGPWDRTNSTEEEKNDTVKLEFIWHLLLLCYCGLKAGLYATQATMLPFEPCLRPFRF
jgi:hypothetical protein